MAGRRSIRLQEIRKQFDHVDDADVLEKAKSNPALSVALRWIRPDYWYGCGLRPEQIMPVAADNGIPVVWVPPTSVLRALVAAEPADRMSVLMANEAEVVDHCRLILEECSDPWVSGERTLIGRSLDAYLAGFHEAAMALAVAVGEPLAQWASVPRVQRFESEEDEQAWEKNREKKKYVLAKEELAAAGPDLSESVKVQRYALIAPIPKFYTPFRGRPGEKIPDTLSRHATVHQPTIEHLSRENALLAVMLCVSLLRQQQDWSEEVRDYDSYRGEN